MSLLGLGIGIMLARVGKMPAFMSKVHAGGIYRYLPAFTGIYWRLLTLPDFVTVSLY